MLIGFIVFTAYPLIFSFILSFSEWDLMSPYKFVGLSNYIRIFTRDRFFLKSLSVTFKFAAMSVPLNLIAAFLVALLMNSKVKGIGIFRTIWYSPAVTPAVAASVLWMAIFKNIYGLINK
jgi:multiple sugar transport system permease protein